MAKTPSDKLHRLIRSLSPQEKRHFRMFIRSKPGESTKYIRLFEAMAAASEFRDDDFRAKIYDNQVLESQKYSELKAYLYELLLKSLQSYDEQQSVEYRLNHLLQSVAALFKRGHYEDCRELLHKAGKIARQYEAFAHQLEVLRWEKHLAYTQMDADFLHKKLEQLQYEETRTLEQLRNASDYRKAFFSVYATIRREATHLGEDRMERLQHLIQQNLFSDPDMAMSHRARVFYYRTMNLYYYAALDYAQFYDSGKKLIELLESQPHFLKENLADYIAALSNLILSCGLLRRYDEVRASLDKLRSLTPLTQDDRRKIHRQYFSNKFVLCIYTGEFEEARQEMLRCQSEAERFDLQDYETASFYFQYCCICFGNGQYDEALHYLNFWLNQPRTVGREDLQSLARILSLILHFEMGNLVLLESLLRSATRFLRKKNRLLELERRFIHGMSELIRSPDSAERKIVLGRMRADLQELSALPGVRSVLQTFDLDAWLESQLSGRTFAQVVREKWLRESGA